MSPCRLSVVALHLGVQRAHRLAFAEDLERDALTVSLRPAAVVDQAFGRPAEHVDEARRDRLAGGVDDLASRVPGAFGPT